MESIILGWWGWGGGGGVAEEEKRLPHQKAPWIFKKTEIISSIFSDYNTMGLDINYKKKTVKKHKCMEIKQHISKYTTGEWRNQVGNQKISGNKWQWKHGNSKPMGCSKSSSKREVHIIKCIY